MHEMQSSSEELADLLRDFLGQYAGSGTLSESDR